MQVTFEEYKKEKKQGEAPPSAEAVPLPPK
jgi:hypothetical protein